MGVPEVVDEECGLLVLPGRADLLAGAIAELADAPSARRHMGLAGRRRVAEEFTLERQGATVAALLGGATLPGVLSHKPAEAAAAAA
jgi:glycosyltransferase involved in cell wall biosynthesis